MRETIEMIVKKLVDDVDAVDVREIPGTGHAVKIEVRVAQSDMGKLIGRQGRTIRSLRAVLHAVSQKGKHRFVLDVIE
jgi:uncharacterized protein